MLGNNVVIEKHIIDKVGKDSGCTQESVTYGCNTRPLYNQVVLVLDKDTEPVSEGGIILDEASEPKSCIGTVLSVGDGLYTASGARLPLTVKRFDKIRVKENFAESMTIAGTEYYVIRETDIMAILP